MKRVRIAALVLVVMLLVSMAAVAASRAEAVAPTGERYKYYVVTHGGVADPFWGVVVKGVRDAGQMFNADVTYLGPETASIRELVDLLETAIAARPDGIVVTITDQSAVDAPLRRAIADGIPVVAINVPDFRSDLDRIPYLAYVGADEYQVGVQAANRMLQEFGATKPRRAVVLIQEVGHVGLETRARGIEDVFGEHGIPVDKLAGASDAAVNYAALDAYLTRHENTDAVFTLGPQGAHPALQLLRDKNLAGGRVKMGAVDLSPTITQAIAEGDMVFTIEQQQYLQGYMPIGLLTLYNNYGLIPRDNILTGPAVVDKSNVDIVVEMVRQNYR